MRYFLTALFAAVFSVEAIAHGPGQAGFVELAKKIRAGVVNISMTKNSPQNRGGSSSFPFPGFPPPSFRPSQKAAGSGFIVDKKGLIITNAHVVSNFDEIQVQFADDKKFYKAEVLGLDPQSDIALLRVKVKKKLIPLEFGDSSALQVGEWVAAIGNPHGYGHTMTQGIVSAVHREIDDLNLFPLLQTDASINPGSSGGPLVNLKGKVVGVNQAIAVGFGGLMGGRATGISFAIPINNVKEVFEDLKSFGFVRKPFIGVRFGGDSRQGAVVVDTIPAGPADKAGVLPKDRIIKFGKTRIQKSQDLSRAVRKSKAGQAVSITVVRAGQPKQLKIIPQMLEKNSFASFQNNKASQKTWPKGQKMPGGFFVSAPSPNNLSHFRQPDLGAEHPLIVKVLPQSPASKGGLKPGDLVFELNGRRITRGAELRPLIRKGPNQIAVLRYHPTYNQYLLISRSFSL